MDTLSAIQAVVTSSRLGYPTTCQQMSHPTTPSYRISYSRASRKAVRLRFMIHTWISAKLLESPCHYCSPTAPFMWSDSQNAGGPAGGGLRSRGRLCCRLSAHEPHSYSKVCWFQGINDEGAATRAVRRSLSSTAGCPASPADTFKLLPLICRAQCRSIPEKGGRPSSIADK
jgi:hypothetical protein